MIEVFGLTSTESLLQATRMSPTLSYHVSDTLSPSCADMLYEYIRAAILVDEDELSNIIPITNRYDLRHPQKKRVEGLLRDGHGRFLQSFIKHTLPDDDLYDVVRTFDTADDMVFLRRLLLIANSEPNWHWKTFCRNLLLYAAKDGNECLVVMLLDVGVDVHAVEPNRLLSHLRGFNAMQYAIHSGNTKVIDILESRGASILTGWRFEDCKFLSQAITQGTMDLARPLLAKAATSAGEAARDGIEVFVHAVKKSYHKVVHVLFDAGFNPFKKTNLESAFTLAVHTSKMGYLERFLKFPYHGLNKKQFRERLRQLTAGFVFAHCSENLVLKDAILDIGWHPDDVTRAMGYDYVQWFLYDALETAVKHSDDDQVNCLIQIGASPNRPKDPGVSSSGETLLRWAMERRNVTIMRQLISAGADINLLNLSSRITPLQEAVYTMNLEIVGLLVGAGAHINSPARPLRLSAIEIAAETGNLAIVAYLLESGADIQGQHNRNYRRALYRAQRNSYSSVVDALQDWKRLRYGEQDCDTVDNIMGTMTSIELKYPSEEARIEYMERETAAGRTWNNPKYL